jgi:hypothetical protein
MKWWKTPSLRCTPIAPGPENRNPNDESSLNDEVQMAPTEKRRALAAPKELILRKSA